jgi:hypothetical protein
VENKAKEGKKKDKKTSFMVIIVIKSMKSMVCVVNK